MPKLHWDVKEDLRVWDVGLYGVLATHQPAANPPPAANCELRSSNNQPARAPCGAGGSGSTAAVGGGCSFLNAWRLLTLCFVPAVSC